jgi:hypothetical protein
MPKNPPRLQATTVCRRLTSSPRMYSAGSVKIAPATTTPDAAPMDWMMTFSRMLLRLVYRLVIPTARMAIGMAASKTCPATRPR